MDKPLHQQQFNKGKREGLSKYREKRREGEEMSDRLPPSMETLRIVLVLYNGRGETVTSLFPSVPLK